MTHNSSLVSFIEAALDATPYCRACGAQTTIEADEDRVVLACSAVDNRKGGVWSRLLAALLPHERSVILDGIA